MITLCAYAPEDKEIWDSIIEDAENAHFMVKRGFMEYHADRFEDCSYLVLKDDREIGAIPGNINGKNWFSHEGLTFGGIFLRAKYNRTLNVADTANALFETLKTQGIERATYKFIPHIYHRAPCEGDMFALQSFDVENLSREVATTVDLHDKTKPSTLRKRGAKKARKEGLIIQESEDFSGFWDVLSERLRTKYDQKPVHTIEEITKLKANFPNNIRLFTVTHPDHGICAGTLMFETHTVAHAQYIASSPEGQRGGALDMLFLHLIDHYAEQGRRFFDFGISTEDKGKTLNADLAQFKEGFGGRPVIHYTATIRV